MLWPCKTFCSLGLLATLFCVAETRGQTTQPEGGAPALVPYTDPAFGFELGVPQGWQYNRERFQEYRNSIGLLRGKGPSGQRVLQIMVFRSFDLPPFEDWLIMFGQELAERTTSERVDWETRNIGGRAGAVLTFASKVGGLPMRLHCLCVPFDPQTVLVLTYTATVFRDDDVKPIRADFDRIVDSLKVMYDPREAEKLGPALDRGRDLLQTLRNRGRDVKIDDTQYFYEILIGDEPIGYLTRQVSKEEHVYSKPNAKHRFAKEGLRVRERSWRFAPDGTARYTRMDLFSAFDMRSELMENRQVQYPAPDIQPSQVLIKTDTLVREDQILFSSYVTNLAPGLPEPSKPISVGPVYLDLAWVRLLPGLLLGREKEPYAFAIYNTDTRALIAHRITPLGKTQLEGVKEPAYAFEVRDGFIEQAARITTDARGNLLRFEAGGLVVRRATPADIEKEFGKKRDAVQQRFPSID